MQNRFNRLTSKEWLPFQKSWTRFSSLKNLYESNLRFFCKAESLSSNVFYYGNSPTLLGEIASELEIPCVEESNNLGQSLQFVIIDLIGQITPSTTLSEYSKIKEHVIEIALTLYQSIEYRRFFTVFIPNIVDGPLFLPFAWDIAKELGSIFSLKDEKIICLDDEINGVNKSSFFTPTKSFFYCLYFRKDDNSKGSRTLFSANYFNNNQQLPSNLEIKTPIPSWFILKPQPRRQNEILHPAKYPEELVKKFAETLTSPGWNIFDPMSGTGSTQIAALKLERNAYGTELSPFFCDIANSRCQEYINPSQMSLFEEPKKVKYTILNKDARHIEKNDFPVFNYLITSPPYWDMLNMKGAENQAKRIERGLQTNYSDDDKDLGNIADYDKFIDELVQIYFSLLKFMEPRSYLTIVVKNIKKSGTNYPFAWDLAHLLQERLILLPEVFWLQDDISIAPYGYGNTWVSNTFHQYCLNFQVPD